MAKKEVQIIVIPPLQTERLSLNVVGLTELICHAWSDKAKKEMLAKQQKKAKQGKTAKDPNRDYRESLYWLNKNGQRIDVGKVDPGEHQLFGFKTIAFKAAAIRAANDVGLAMTLTRRAFHVLGEFVKLDYESMYMREDMVRLNGGVADLRYRGAFSNWSTVLDIQYNAGIISAEQLTNLFNTAGFGVGVGEWRPEKNGVSGRFEIAK